MTEEETAVEETPVLQQVKSVNIEDAILDHLVIPESADALWRARLDLTVVGDDGVRETMEFVFKYLEEYDRAPTASVIAAEIGFDEFSVPEVPIEYVIDKLRQRKQRRELKRITTHMARNTDSPAEALQYGLTEIARLRIDTEPKGTSLDTHDPMLPRYEYYKERGVGASFGFDEIDAVLGGMHQGELYFGIGRPKRCKSWLFHVRSALHNLHAGRSSLIYSLEMTEEEMHNRLSCMEAGVSWSKFKALELCEKELDMIAAAQERLKEYDGMIYIRRPLMGERTVSLLVQEAKLFDVSVVYIDQLQQLEAKTTDRTPQHQQIRDICIELKEAATYWPIMVAAQFNRDAENMTEMGDLTKIGLSDAIGQTADLLMGLYADKEMRQEQIVQMGVIESRSFGGYPRWDMKIDLSFNSNLRCLGPTTFRDD